MSTRRKKKRPQGLTPLERYVLMRAVMDIFKAEMAAIPIARKVCKSKQPHCD